MNYVWFKISLCLCGIDAKQRPPNLRENLEGKKPRAKHHSKMNEFWGNLITTTSHTHKLNSHLLKLELNLLISCEWRLVLMEKIDTQLFFLEPTFLFYYVVEYHTSGLFTNRKQSNHLIAYLKHESYLVVWNTNKWPQLKKWFFCPFHNDFTWSLINISTKLNSTKK